MNQLSKLYQTTLELKSILDKDITSEKREQIIEQINKLVEQRSIEMSQITPPYTKHENQLGQEIVLLNTEIEKEMNKLFEALKQEMKLIKKQKETNRSYINPYGKMTSTDGMYVDSKQ